MIDPEIENGQESWTPYSFGFDNAVRFNDTNGRCPDGCPPNRIVNYSALNGTGNAASQPDLITALQKPISNIVDGITNTVSNTLDTMEHFSTAHMGKGVEQLFGIVMDAIVPNGTSPGGNTAKHVHKMDGDKLNVLLDATGAVINRKGRTYGEAVQANKSRNIADVRSAAADAIDTHKAANAEKDKVDTVAVLPASFGGKGARVQTTKGNTKSETLTNKTYESFSDKFKK